MQNSIAAIPGFQIIISVTAQSTTTGATTSQKPAKNNNPTTLSPSQQHTGSA
jgi:hypothetical protein